MNLQIFKNKEFGEIRTIEVNGKFYFVGKDIAEALGYSNPQKAIRDHCKGVNESFIPSNGGEQKMNVIPEGDIYRLIVRSQLPSAEKFETWVFDEVLPSIRQNGGYIANQENLTPEQIVANALVVAQNIINNQNKQIEELKPKAEYADKLLKTKDNILVREFAKVLCDEGFVIGEKKLYVYLRDNKFLMKNNEPYQRYLDNKTFIVDVNVIETPFGEKQTRTTKITPSGQLFLFKKITG